MKKRTVLIAEDQEELLYSMAKFLERKFDVYKAKHGLEAWETIQKHNIDCLVTDIDMPEMNGLELLETMRNAGYNNKVIVSTGRNCFDTRIRCEALGVRGYLLKPYDISPLPEMITAGV